MREEAYAVRRNVDKALVLHTLRRIKFERGRRRTIADERNLDVAERVSVETLADETLRREMRRFDTGHWVDFFKASRACENGQAVFGANATEPAG